MTKIEVSRQQLYDLVWRGPIKEAARQIDSSYEEIVRACTEFDVPRPPSGYWVKIFHKVAVDDKPALEGSRHKTIHMRAGAKARQDESDRQARCLSQFKSFSEVRVHPRLLNPHHAVAIIVNERKQGFKSPGGSGFIHKLHSSRVDDVTKRIFRILDCLAKALSKEGFSVASHRMGGIEVTWNRGETIFRIKERLRMSRDAKGNVIRDGQLDRTGALFSESPHTFEDRAGLPIEDQVQAVLESIALACLSGESKAQEKEDRAKRIEARRAELLAERKAAKLKNDAIEKL